MIPLRHPLHITRCDRTTIPHAVAVLHRSGKNISNRLNPAVRMPWKTRQIVFGNIVAEIIQKKKWVKVLRASETKRAPQMHACALQGGLGFNKALYRSNGHLGLQRSLRT